MPEAQGETRAQTKGFGVMGITMRSSRRELLRAFFAGISAAAPPARARAQAGKPVRVALPVIDIPRLWAGPEGGLSNLGYSGYSIYDALINWDLDHEDRASGLVPGLAESWSVDPVDSARWIFTLRSGVNFHDGSPFDADAVVWNFNSVFDAKAPNYNAVRAALIRGRLFGIAGAEKIATRTIAVRSHGPDATLPFQVSFLLMASPAQFGAVGSDWQKFAAQPSGTGPFRFLNLVPHTRLELVRNDQYWDGKRIARAPALTLIPAPDANARISALRAGQVDLIETVPPDAIPSLDGAGFPVRSNIYPTVLVWSLSLLPDSPFHDLRVRKAANLAVDRSGLVKLLNGAAVAAQGFVTPDSPWFGHASFRLEYAPDEARKLLAAAGYGPDNRAKAKTLITGTGGGQMEPLKVNEFVQANLAAVGIDVELQVVDYTTLLTIYRLGAKAPQSAGLHGIGLPAPTHDPTSTFVRGFHSELVAPRGFNWGYYSNRELDEALSVVSRAFEPPALDKAIAEVNRILLDDVPYLLLIHERNPWGLSPRIKNFILPQSRFANWTSVSVD
jgi:ABC-type transport system substrate-binding protein